jgi:hypothetical protein
MNLSLGHSSRFFFGLSCILVLLTLSLSTQNMGANQESPYADEVQSELTIRKVKLIKLKSGLEAFMARKKVADIPLNALFMIDLTDTNAVVHHRHGLDYAGCGLYGAAVALRAGHG